MDRYADLLHVRDSYNNSFINQNEIQDIELELFYPMTIEQIKFETELESFKHQFHKMSKTPLDLIKKHSNEDDILKEIFEGFSSGILKLKDQSISVENLDNLALLPDQ